MFPELFTRPLSLRVNAASFLHMQNTYKAYTYYVLTNTNKLKLVQLECKAMFTQVIN